LSGTGAFGRDSDNETKLGWVIGLGGEYALSESWTIRGEYLYADYGKVDTTALVTNPAFPTLANDLKSSVELKTQILSVGVSYRF
jgi:opacity protein-like surface antigen